ncbi:MAG: tetratricopeptide repeat protein [Bacteroidaceae bacterium]|nr:tetratricopeptide repeat protein [Bacteroidaceae bacterium]
MRKVLYYILAVCVIAGISGCASKRKNTATTRAYHAFTARYNTYYNGNVAYKQALKAQSTGHKDNYLQELPLLIISDKSTQKNGASNYDRAIEKSQKAIKNHSIKRRPKKPAGKKLSQKQKLFYSQKEFNPFLWKAWFLMANSQFQKGEFTEAASTYIYITKLYETNPTIVARARIGLAKCYAEMEWLYESEELLQRIQRDTVPESLQCEYAVAKANLLLKQERGEEAIPHIRTGLKRKGVTSLDKAREYYLLGQLYAKTGNKKEAYKSFGKTIAQSPPYEFEFNARIRQTETATDENHKKTLRKLKRMAKSDKNVDYQAQIYYAIGNLHLSQGDTAEAVKAYETGVATGATSGYGTGMLHLSLAKLYWEKEKFSKSHDNYTKAMSMLNEETPGFDEIKFRSEALAGVIQYTDIVEREGELLYWATLPPEQLYPILDELIEEAKLQEELRKKEEKKLARENGDGSELDKAGANADMTINEQSEKQLWYFYNPQLVSQGVRAFKQKWGDRELKDYWRFSNTISSLMSDNIEADSMMVDSLGMEGNLELTDSIAGEPEMEEAAEEPATDPTTREYYLQQIPVTDEQKEASHKALREALLEAGIRFKDDVNDKRLTIKYLERVANDYPEYERLSDAYYHLFLACSRWDEPEKAEHYKNLLIAGYPDSTVTKRIQDPDFFESAAARKHKEDSVYVKAYAHYNNQEYDAVIEENLYSATKYPQGSHRARFMFIDAMAKLYCNRSEDALAALEELIKAYPTDSISILATGINTGIKEGRLLHSGISTSIWERKADGTIRTGSDSIPQFSTSRNEPYYFVLAFPKDSLDEKRLLFEMARYNFSRYMVRNFEMTFENLAEVTLLEVKEFLNFDEAFLYRKRLYGNAETARLLEGINAFIISKSNLDLLLQYYTFGDYSKFYDENFLAIPEVEIDGYTLDEPDYGDDEEESELNKNEE